MKQPSTRPVLSMNFYQPPNQQNRNPNITPQKQLFGIHPYHKMIQEAEQQKYYRQVVEKEQVQAVMKDVSQILENFLPGETLERTANFSNTEDKSSDKPSYHSEPEYFSEIRKKLTKINKLIEKFPAN